VTLGASVDGLRVVSTGLVADDVIVINGLQHVKPGIAVAPTKVAMDGDRAGVAQLAAPDAAKTLVAARVSPASHSQR
ncbi:MAG: efflux transporter periplasmic adaptor subunit, partial [Rhodanobacteraceae bacterium]